MWLEAYIFSLLTAANTQVTGWWRGVRPVLVSLVAAAACLFGVKSYGFAGAHEGWDLYKEAGLVRRTEALRDLGSSESSLHFLALRRGDWPVRLVDTQMQMP